MLKYLRIAVTALSLTACVLLIALWVRSYRYIDTVFPSTPFRVALKSQSGQISIGIGSGSWSRPFKFGEMGIDSSIELKERSWNIVEKLPGDRRLLLPHLPIALFFAAVAVVPWIRRFALRTLLIAMTLVAVALGIVVAACK